MTPDSLLAAIRAAERFLEAAGEARLRMVKENGSPISGSKETAEAKRASLDLTRRLAEMRNPNFRPLAAQHDYTTDTGEEVDLT